MPNSMTAFAQAREDSDLGEISCELRTVNHRFLEISPRLPEELRQFEPNLRDLITQKIKRGRVDCTVRFQLQFQFNESQQLQVNESLAKALISLASEIRGHGPDVEPIRVVDILRWPGVIRTPKLDTENLQSAFTGVVTQALEELVITREREGKRLTELIMERVSEARKSVHSVKDALPRINEVFRRRLQERVNEVREQMDENRIEQEILMFMQKMDVSEEIDRLQVHLDEVQSVLATGHLIGRRLDFLMQELHREANTLGAKSVDTAMTQTSVELKVLIEQMREQVQNIE